MLRMLRLLRLGIAALAMLVLSAVSLQAAVYKVPATTVDTNLTLDNGWYWFNPDDGWGIWTFAASSKVGDTCYLNVRASIQGSFGGSGYSKQLTFWVWPSGKLPAPVIVSMFNPFAPRDDSNTQGLGWDTVGNAQLQSYVCSGLKTKKVSIYYEKEPGSLVALNKDSVFIAFSAR